MTRPITQKSNGDVIVCPAGSNKGIWCRTQEAYDAIAKVARLHPSFGGETSGTPLPSLIASYQGIVVSVASAEKWAELETEFARP